MPDGSPSIGWGGPTVGSVVGQAPNALAPSPQGFTSTLGAIAAALSPSSIAAALGAPHGGYAPGSPGAIAHGGPANTTGMTSAHGWGSAPSSINASLSPQQAADLGYTVSTMNTNQAAINDAIANNSPVFGMPNQTSQDAYGYTSLAAPPNAQLGYSDAVSAPMGYGYGINQGQTAAVADALGYSDSQSSPTGYGYGMNLGSPSATEANAPDPGSTAASLAEAQGYSDSQSADTGYGYGLSLGAPASTSEGDDDGGDDAGDAGDGGDGGW